MKRYHSLGFTLNELLVVISAIVILSGITLIYFSIYSPSVKLKGEANQIVNQSRKTQNYALTEQEIYAIKFIKSSGNYSIYKIVDNNETLVESLNLQNGISFASNDLEIRFNAAGIPSTSADIIIQNNKGQQTTIQITSIGYVKII